MRPRARASVPALPPRERPKRVRASAHIASAHEFRANTRRGGRARRRRPQCRHNARHRRASTHLWLGPGGLIRVALGAGCGSTRVAAAFRRRAAPARGTQRRWHATWTDARPCAPCAARGKARRSARRHRQRHRAAQLGSHGTAASCCGSLSRDRPVRGLLFLVWKTLVQPELEPIRAIRSAPRRTPVVPTAGLLPCAAAARQKLQQRHRRLSQRPARLRRQPHTPREHLFSAASPRHHAAAQQSGAAAAESACASQELRRALSPCLPDACLQRCATRPRAAVLRRSARHISAAAASCAARKQSTREASVAASITEPPQPRR